MTCWECAGVMPAYVFGRPRLYCSDACTRKNGKRVQRLVERAIQAGCHTVDRIDPIAIFVRDGWRCQLCSLLTSRAKLGSLDADAPSMDHKRALCDGGQHTPENVRLLCNGCNRTKGKAEQSRAGRRGARLALVR